MTDRYAAVALATLLVAGFSPAWAADPPTGPAHVLTRTFGADVDISHAGIVSGRLYIVGRTRRAFTTVSIDGTGHSVKSNILKAFQFALDWRPGDCRVTLKTASGSVALLVGSCGPTGPAGPQGPVGPIGLTGSTGATGAPGLQGPVGPKGPQGPQGVAGTMGPVGPQGQAGAGFTPRGPWNPADAYQPNDVVTLNGSSYVAMSMTQGDVPGAGSEWLQLVERGEMGETGEQGPIGESGPQGVSGPQGPVGASGEKGEAGPQGPVGEIGPEGPQGQAGAGFTPRGPWNPADAYQPNDVVSFNGSSYVATSMTQGDVPGAGSEWMQLVERGEKGETGEQGPIGESGPQGVSGPQGPAGTPGEKGETGEQGPIGESGPQGVSGPQGPAGAAGLTALTHKTTSCSVTTTHTKNTTPASQLAGCALLGLSVGNYIILLQAEHTSCRHSTGELTKNLGTTVEVVGSIDLGVTSFDNKNYFSSENFGYCTVNKNNIMQVARIYSPTALNINFSAYTGDFDQTPFTVSTTVRDFTAIKISD